MAHVNLDFERREHLVNWLIKSGPHMKVPAGVTPLPGKKHHHQHQQQQIMVPPPQNALWLPQGVFKPTAAPCMAPPQHVVSSPGGGGGGVPILPSSPFTSQTNLNLPLQLFSAPHFDGHKPKLRRFNSHDTSANMFSVTEFENNARIAKQQSKQHQQQCDSMNRKNSLNDYYSTSRESSGGQSRTAEEEVLPAQEIMPIDKFLLKSVLPKVVRVYSPNDRHSMTTMGKRGAIVGTGSSSMTSSSGDSRPDGSAGDKPQQGRLMFIYRHIPNRKIFKAHNTKSSDKRRSLKIPQDLKGYFSLVNEKGQATAAVYSKVIELVRERVYKFLTLENMVAYNESFSEVIPMKSQYVKATIKAGQTFRILAVFEDDRSRNQKNSSGVAAQPDREKIRGRYVQILSETRQMFYVPLTTKGKFYEVAVNSNSNNSASNQQPQQPPISQSNRHNSGHEMGRKPDCVYRISDLVLNNSSLPLNLKLIYAPSFVDLPDYITVEDMLREDILLGCAIPEKESQQRNSPLQLAKLTVFPDIKLQKCLMGHKDERRLLASPVFQHWIEFCKTHSEVRLQAVEVEQISQAEVEERRQLQQQLNHNTISNTSSLSSNNSMIVVSPTGGGGGASSSTSTSTPLIANTTATGNCPGSANQHGKRSKVESLKLLRPLNLAKFLGGGGRDKNYVAHEVEDSIIFLTKSDLEKIEAQKNILRRVGGGMGRVGSEQSIRGSTDNVTANVGLDVQQGNNSISDKMKVFEQEKRSSSNWLFSDRKSGGKKTKTKSFTSYDILHKNLTANDRYCDMSKMIEERFGDLSLSTMLRDNERRGVGGGASTRKANGPLKSASVTDITARDANPQPLVSSSSRYSMNKTFSLENLNHVLSDRKPRSRHSFSASSQTPDLVRIISQHEQLPALQQQQRSSAASSVENIGQLYPATSSQCLASSHYNQSRDESSSSFISEKMYTEFHVKTKMHSKSSTHLNRWPFQAKSNGKEGHHQPQPPPQRTSPMKRTSSIVNISDYRQDTVPTPPPVVLPSRITILHKTTTTLGESAVAVGGGGGAKEFINTNTDEYYAEIYNGRQNNNMQHTSRTQIVNVL